MIVLAIVGVCLLSMAGCGVLVVRAVINATTIPYAGDPDRYRTNAYGTPLLMGPIHLGAPTYGESSKADLENEDQGWTFTNPQRTGQKWAFMSVKNKSEHTWNDVQAVLKLYDKQGNYLSTVYIDFGSIDPGQTGSGKVEIDDDNVYLFELAGYNGH